VTDLIDLAAHRPKTAPCPLSQALCTHVGAPEPQGLAAVIDLAERRRTARLTASSTPRRPRKLPACPFAPLCWLRPAAWRCPLSSCPSCGGPAA
jgi:hypothetical protein